MSFAAGAYSPVPQHQEKIRASDFPNNDIIGNQGSMSKMDLPRIPVEPRQHKLKIAINFGILIIMSGIMPVILFFALKYGTKVQLSTVVAIPTAVFGAGSLYNMVNRTYRLTKKDPFYRPIGGSRKGLDFFQWNFIIGFVYITAIIVAGNVIVKDHPSTAIRIISMPISILMLIVSTELLIGAIAVLARAKSPIRLSSIERGARARPGSYVIAEDICAVDGGLGEKFRIPFDGRYRASREIRSLLLKTDLIWGLSGATVGAILMATIWWVSNPEIGFALGWIVPWIWAGVLAFITIKMTSAAKKREAVAFGSASA